MVITIALDVCWNGHQSICDVSTLKLSTFIYCSWRSFFFKYWPQNGCISIEIIQQNQNLSVYTDS